LSLGARDGRGDRGVAFSVTVDALAAGELHHEVARFRCYSLT
jgi:hypothetical protein